MEQEIGNWILREPIQEGVWADWFAGENRRTKVAAWLRWIPSQQITENSIKPAVPSLSRTRRIASLQSSAVQRVLAVEAVNDGLLIALEPLAGIMLADQLANRRYSESEALALVAHCTQALAQLHAADIVHGRVLPDRIHKGVDGRITLVCDPLCWETNRIDLDHLGVFRSSLPKGLRGAHFLAPEFLVPGTRASKATDIYALGCVWWLLQFRRPTVGGDNEQAILIAQAQRGRDEPWKSALAEPLMKCLRHCLAKNPTARFSDAVTLQAALDESFRGVGTTISLPTSIAKPEGLVAKGSVEAAIHSPVARPPMPSQSAKQATTDKRSSVPASTPRRLGRKKRGPKWILPAIGAGVAASLLMIAFLSGALGPSRQTVDVRGNGASGQAIDREPASAPVAMDPRSDQFEIVAREDSVPWLPPSLPRPIELDLLPHGGQLFIAVRPRQLFTQTTTKQILALLDKDISSLWKHLQAAVKLPLESFDSCTLAFYPRGSAAVAVAIRCRLAEPQSLARLRESWGAITEQKYGEQTLLLAPSGMAYYVPGQPLVDSQSVRDFAIGPHELMKETAQMNGVAGPMNAQVERLLQHTDAASDLCILVSPSFLFGDSREFLGGNSPELLDGLEKVIGGDVRAAMLRTSFEPTWYFESRLIGVGDRDAARLSEQAKRLIGSSESEFQQRIVTHVPHPYWRELAFKFPRMLEIFSKQTRTGVEYGQAVINGYLPSSAAANILLASWLAVREDGGPSSASSTTAGTTAPTATEPMDMETYLARPITLRFDQEAIEVALQMIADEANSGLPAGARKPRFELDGGAFEKNGITRNQQVRDFQFSSKPMRDALTALAKRGNPDPSVTNLSDENQKLVWVVKPDPTQPGAPIISLTTRDAATAANIPVPKEFVAQ